MNIDWNAILPILIGIIPATLFSLASLIQSIRNGKVGKDLAVSINGKMEELIRVNRSDATAQATLNEKAAETVRQENR